MRLDEEIWMEHDPPQWMLEAARRSPLFYNAWEANSESEYEAWGDFALNHSTPDDLNELVNFHFDILEGPTLVLRLWWILPRKEHSYRSEVALREEDVPVALEWLRQAAERNAERFRGVAQ